MNRAAQRRTLLAGAVALAMLGGVVALAVRFGVRPAPAPPASPPKVIVDSDANCETMAMRYRQALLRLQTCTRDEDCKAERRDRFNSGLDGCARFLRRDADIGVDVEPYAAAWHARGCAHSFMSCGDARAQCSNGLCAELPPEPVPRSWHRVIYAEEFSFFVPPGTVERRVDAEDSRVGSYRAPGFDVLFDYSVYATGLDADEMFGEVELHNEEVMVAGLNVPGVLTMKRTASGHFMAGIHIPEMTTSLWGVTRLTFFAECKTEAACRDALIVARSLTFH